LSDPIVCDVHGESVATIVCVHILDTLQDDAPRGFWWAVDDEGEYDAICEECNNMSDEEWAASSTENCCVLCFECYARAAKLNGIEMVRKHS
jgi:hypothetical protein